MIQVIKTIFDLGPLLFAFGFIAPLTMQVIERAGWVPPFGLSPLVCGLGLAALLGGIAQIRGRWL
ncbi:hypothetical protein RYZ27_04145 [Hyphomonas sp. FCG-A18]|uniref:hypothetical protein n=1 Tax=Hyphomonas sp. FCG-A18 TaxID=3080019 RepID=UPI002B2D39CF|nr:hypothetical protein RYZ27_04145 [Hyphomonas sp. FCG-A18]